MTVTRVTRSRAAEPTKIPEPPPAPASNPKAYVAPDDDRSGPKVDYNAVIKRYADKVTNRGSAIRAKCVECSGGALSEVRDCPITKCALWPYRMGSDPNNKKTAKKLAAQAGEDGDGDE